MILDQPTSKAVAAAFDKAIKAANRRAAGDQALVVTDADKACANCIATAEGVHVWVTPRDNSTSSPHPYAVLAWWTDSTGHKTVNVHGGRCESGSPLSNNGAAGMPPVWHVFPEACYFVDSKMSSDVLLLCGCGAFGTAKELDWRRQVRGTGGSCKACEQARGPGQEPVPAAIKARVGRFTPDGNGIICVEEATAVHLDLNTGAASPLPLKDPSLYGPLLFHPTSTECLMSTNDKSYRWNWSDGSLSKFTRMAGAMNAETLSPDGGWFAGPKGLQRVDWSQSGNPVQKPVEAPTKTGRKKEAALHAAGAFVSDRQWIGIQASGQIDSIDPATGQTTMLKPATPFPGLRQDANATPRIVDIHWSQDLICLAFSYDDAYFGRDLPPILIGNVRKPGPCRILQFRDDFLPVEGLLRFTPDGQWLLWASEANVLTFVPVNTGTRQSLSFALPHHREIVCRVEYAPDGQSMLLTAHNNYVCSLENEDFVRRVPCSSQAFARLFQSRKTPAERFPRTAAKKATPATPKSNHFAPCTIGEAGDWHCLSFSDFDASQPLFEEFGRNGGGYTWQATVESLIRLKSPTLERKLQFDSEASCLVALSKQRTAVEDLARLIQSALSDTDLLRTAIEKAKPDLD